MMEAKPILSELIDFSGINSLLEGFSKATGSVTAILDLDGNVLSGSGWRKICTEFHRKHPETAEKCTLSDTCLMGKIQKGEKHVSYKCLNGLVDLAVPIVVNGEHVGNLFSGQLLFEEPDLEFFRQQAAIYRFDEQAYLEALKMVPVVSEKEVTITLDFLLNMAELISHIAHQKRAQDQLVDKLTEREKDLSSALENAMECEIRMAANEEYLKETQRIAGLGTYNLDVATGIWTSSEILDEIFGIGEDHDKSVEGWLTIIHPEYREIMNDYLVNEVVGKKTRFDYQYKIIRQNDHAERWVHGVGNLLLGPDNQPARMIGTIRDITDQKNSELALQKSQSLLLEVEKIGKVGGWEFNIDTLEQTWTQETYEIHEVDYTFEPNVESGINFYTPSSKTLIEKVVANAITNGEPFNVESEIITAKGNLRQVNAIGNADLANRRVYGFFQDITARKQVEKDLLVAKEKAVENEAIIKAALENSQAGIVIVEFPSGKLKYVNNAALLFRGAEKGSAVKGLNIGEYLSTWNVLHIDGTPYPDKAMPLDRNILFGKANSSEFIVRRENREDRIIWANTAPIYNTKGHLTSAILILLDISGQKQIEKELRMSEINLVKAQQITHIGSWYLDLVTNRVTWTEELYKMYNFDPSLPPPPYTEHQKLFTPESWEVLSSSLAKTSETGIPYELELETVKADGKNGWMWVRGETIQNHEGKTIALWGAAQDISERKFIEEELIRAKVKAEQSDLLKTAFLANMSHEIRTPMNGILGFAELLKEPNLTGDEQQYYISIIEKSGARMLNIINEIIDISKIESGHMNIELKEADINSHLEYISTFFKPEIEKKGIALSVRIANPGQSLVVKTDHEKLIAILTNLIKNAIKYIESGSIEIGYETKGRYIEFFVKDTGVGIPGDKLHSIFDRFVQADISDLKARQGAGLGLTISKSFVEMLGGEIWVESTEGKGSSFYFTIPNIDESPATRVINHNKLPLEKFTSTNDIKILVVEDDETSNVYLGTIFKGICKETLFAKNGKEAIALCREHKDIDIILMDIKMPVMNGYDATHQIRRFNKEVVIIAQTAFAFESDINNAMEAGCNDFISKPITKSHLLFLISKHMSGKKSLI